MVFPRSKRSAPWISTRRWRFYSSKCGCAWRARITSGRRSSRAKSPSSTLTTRPSRFCAKGVFDDEVCSMSTRARVAGAEHEAQVLQPNDRAGPERGELPGHLPPLPGHLADQRGGGRRGAAARGLCARPPVLVARAVQALRNVVLYVILAPYSAEQWELSQRVRLNQLLDRLPEYRELLALFLQQELIFWKTDIVKQFEPLLRHGSRSSPATDVFSPRAAEAGARRWDALQSRVGEHVSVACLSGPTDRQKGDSTTQNVRMVAKYYSRISLPRLAELLEWPLEVGAGRAWGSLARQGSRSAPRPSCASWSSSARWRRRASTGRRAWWAGRRRRRRATCCTTGPTPSTTSWTSSTSSATSWPRRRWCIGTCTPSEPPRDPPLFPGPARPPVVVFVRAPPKFIKSLYSHVLSNHGRPFSTKMSYSSNTVFVRLHFIGSITFVYIYCNDQFELSCKLQLLETWKLSCYEPIHCGVGIVFSIVVYTSYNLQSYKQPIKHAFTCCMYNCVSLRAAGSW